MIGALPSSHAQLTDVQEDSFEPHKDAAHCCDIELSGNVIYPWKNDEKQAAYTDVNKHYFTDHQRKTMCENGESHWKLAP